MRTSSAVVCGVALVLGAVLLSRQRPATPPQPPVCKYEENCECAVPGITVRWRASYCMALKQTDDFENEAVSGCLSEAYPEAVQRLAACEQNAHWKGRLCRTLHEGDEQKVKACAADPGMIPGFVEFGAGAP